MTSVDQPLNGKILLITGGASGTYTNPNHGKADI